MFPSQAKLDLKLGMNLVIVPNYAIKTLLFVFFDKMRQIASSNIQDLSSESNN
jgi:hypothetical protein